MITEEYKSLKELTDAQKAKCDKVVKLLLELKKSGVHPLVIDGGGGGGLQFIRCNKDDMFDIGEELLGCNAERKSEIDDYIYGPNGYWNVAIDTLAP